MDDLRLQALDGSPHRDQTLLGPGDGTSHQHQIFPRLNPDYLQILDRHSLNPEMPGELLPLKHPSRIGVRSGRPRRARAIGLLRCISTGVRMHADWFDGDDPFARARPLDDRRHSVDHFYTKLLGLPGTMRTAAGCTEAERRVAFLRAFLSQLGDELGRDVPER